MTTYSFDDSEAYEEFMGRWSRAVGKAFLAGLHAPIGAHWLDVGCGTGILTELIATSCSPASLVGVDPSEEQIAYARKGSLATGVTFHVADAQQLPFADASFDVIASALVMNFVPDRVRAMSEMRRVARPGALIAACVWDFAAELSPSGPLRRAMRRFGFDPPPVPGTDASGLAELANLFRRAGLIAVTTATLEVAVTFRSFDEYWSSQTRHAPTTNIIATMSPTDRQVLMQAVEGLLRPLPGGVGYFAHANAVRGNCPG